MLRCFECSSRFDWNFALKHHAARYHNNEEFAQTSCPLPPHKRYDRIGFFVETCPTYRCAICQHKTHSSLLAIDHATRQHTVHRCTKCSYQTNEKEMLTTHELQRHVFQCEQCSYRSNRSDTLRTHMLRHVAPEQSVWFDCTQCSYKTNYKYGLKRHMLTHAAPDEVKLHECGKCSYRSKYKSAWARHMASHATAVIEEPSWKLEKNLKAHVASRHFSPGPRSHEQAEQFYCPKCSYRSKRKDTLKTHMLRHATPEQSVWFHCSHVGCSYRTKNKHIVKRHMLKHAAPEEVKLYGCGECSYRSKYKSALARHTLTHGVLPLPDLEKS